MQDSEYRGLSFWHDTSGDPLVPRPALGGDSRADVVIIGGGLTGLWTAYYLSLAEPGLDILVVEKEVAGFGASGRNGGWCSALFPASAASLERRHGREAAVALRRAMVDTVSEVGRVIAAEHIDCDWMHGGTVAFARSGVQLAAAKAEIEEARGYGVDELQWWDAERAPRASGSLGAAWDPACARLHPAKLVRSLARLVESRGVRIAEKTAVLHYSTGRVETTRGVIECDRVVVALEGYAATLPQSRRRILPLYSLMIATEPLPESTWSEIGLEHGQTFADYRHLIIYGQRTADNRFAFGGRGARYHWGSSIDPGYERVPRVFDHLRAALGELFPQVGHVGVTHRWGGPLGVPRDWHAAVGWDPSTRIATAGGYVGDGLSTTNLAGRTLADLLLDRSTELTALPWVGHRSPDWEPEPLRFAGANLGLVAMTIADAEERVTRRPSLAARLMGPLTGH